MLSIFFVALRPKGQLQTALPLAALVAVIQGGLEGVLTLEPLFCFTCLFLMQRTRLAVLVQFS